MNKSHKKVLAVVLLVILALMPVFGNLLRYYFSGTQIIDSCIPTFEDCPSGPGNISIFIVMHFIFKIIITIPLFAISLKYYQSSDMLKGKKRHQASDRKLNCSIFISLIGSIVIWTI